MTKWFVLGLIVGAVLVLGGCNGYPRFDPATCSTVQWAGDSPIVWECVK